MYTAKGTLNRDDQLRKYSPLVRRQTGFTAGMGVSWTGWRSDTLAQD